MREEQRGGHDIMRNLRTSSPGRRSGSGVEKMREEQRGGHDIMRNQVGDQDQEGEDERGTEGWT